MVQVNEIIETSEELFSFALFERIMFGKEGATEDANKEEQQEEEIKDSIYILFDEYIDKLKSEKRIGSVNSYSDAERSFMRFAPKLSCKDITPLFLYQYEYEMLEQKKSITTIGFYTRALRTIINIALERGLITQQDYPFGAKAKKKYEIPKGENIKKAIKADCVKEIIGAKNLPESMNESRDM